MSDYQYNPNVEQWKEIPDFPSYEVYDHGRVRSYFKQGVVMTTPQKVIKPSYSLGYQRINICKNGKRYMRTIHNLVLTSFVGPCPDNMEACHKDGNRANNILTNLRWDTKISNYKDRHNHGTENNGYKNGRAKLTDDQVKEIRLLYYSGSAFQSELAIEYGVGQTQISRIIRNLQWTHI
jgi:hypothetical protein